MEQSNVKIRLVWVVLNRHFGRTTALKPKIETSYTKYVVFFPTPAQVWDAKINRRKFGVF